MNSGEPDDVAAKRRRLREERRRSIRAWVDVLREQPPEVWGPQLNRLIDSQLRSARETGLDAAHYARVRGTDRDGGVAGGRLEEENIADVIRAFRDRRHGGHDADDQGGGGVVEGAGDERTGRQ